MRTARISSAIAGAAMLAPFLTALHAQNGHPPLIRLSTAHGGYVASNYIEPAVFLSEDSYVFAIAVDVDRQIRVLHPEFPGISVKMAASRQLMLPRFFAGFGEEQRRDTPGYAYSRSSFDSYYPGLIDTRGTVIALASRRPFNLASITVQGDWDHRALRRLVDGKDPHAAASALARELGSGAEPIGRDVLRFAGEPHYYTSGYASSYYGCDIRYGTIGFLGGFMAGYPLAMIQIARLNQAGYSVAFLGVDACGQPQFAVYPNAFAPKPGRPPARGAFPRSRLPVGVPRNPTRPPTSSDRVAGFGVPGKAPASRVPPVLTRIPTAGYPAADRNPTRSRTVFPDRRATSAPVHIAERIAPRVRTEAPGRIDPPAARPERTRPAPQPERVQPRDPPPRAAKSPRSSTR